MNFPFANQNTSIVVRKSVVKLTSKCSNIHSDFEKNLENSSRSTVLNVSFGTLYHAIELTIFKLNGLYLFQPITSS